MKKVININFQGRVIPIEETAYDMLTRYVESLRLFFANEEGRDEIINDIEGRIAELFGETLKKGSTCITDADVNTIINSMGRPEDFEADEAKVQSQLGGENGRENFHRENQQSKGPRRFYRDENHKVVAGVCSGLANYLGIDPVVVRIITIITAGVTLVPYLILWVAVPSSASTVIGSQRKRLFRDPDSKVVAGVCSGLAQYFALSVWIPRVLFLIPFFSFVFSFNHWGFWDFPHNWGLSFSPTSIFVYVILWLVLPEAKNAAEKLEMKGEKVDLNNIKTTIQGDLEGFKDRAQQFGSELKDKAQEFGENLGQKGRQMRSEAEPVIRRSRRGLGDIIALLAKIFAYFVVGCILFVVVVSLFSVGVAVTSMLPFKDYLIRDGLQNLFTWGTLVLFIWVPVVGIVTWIIRRLAKKKGNSSLLRYTFIALWLVGLFCAVSLAMSLHSDFLYHNSPVEQNIALSNPNTNKLEVRIAPYGRYFEQNWLRFEPFTSLDGDTAFVRNIRIRLVKTKEDSFLVTLVKVTNGRTKQEANLAGERIDFRVQQMDSLLLLDKGIAITPDYKFRNQQVILTIAVPVGKRILINDKVGWSNDLNFHFGPNNDWNWENEYDEQEQHWDHNVEYVMTAKGLERTDNTTQNDASDNSDDNSNEALEQFRNSREQMQKEKEQKLKELQEIENELNNSVDSTRYHYQPSAPDTVPATAPKKIKVTSKNAVVADVHTTSINDLLFVKFSL